MTDKVTWCWFPDWPPGHVPSYPTVPVDTDSEIVARVVTEPVDVTCRVHRRAVYVTGARLMRDQPPAPAPALTVARIGHDQLCFPIAPLECALNGWIGLGPWEFGPQGTRRIVLRCKRIDGLLSARVQGAARA